MQLTTTTFAATLALLAAGRAVSQTPQAPLAPAPITAVVPPLELSTDVGTDGRIWAVTETWKASFDAAGTVFVPCFGAAAPRSFPTTFGRGQVRVDGRALPGGEQAPLLSRNTVTFTAPAHRELYELRPEGIEQKFVFDTLPSRGAIDVVVPATTELAVQALAGGHRFVGEFGSFLRGRAVAIDADGDRIDLETTWNGSAFLMTVPAAFVAAATLPLVIDPLVGNVTMFTDDTKQLLSTDMAYDDTMGRFAITWERVFSATDSDVYVRYLDALMQPVGNSIIIDSSLTSWRRPRIAGLNANDRFLVVAEVSTGNSSPFKISGRLVMGLAATVGAQFDVLAGLYDRRNPDVGGDSSPNGPSRFCVTFESAFAPTDHDVLALLCNSDGSLSGSLIDIDSGFTNETQPVVSKSCGKPGGGTEAWAITYRRDDPSGTSEQRIAAVSRAGTIAFYNFGLPGSFDTAGSSVAVSSPTDHEVGRRFVTARIYPQWSGTQSGMNEYAVDLTGTVVATAGATTISAPPAPGLDIDSDGTRFLMVRTIDNPSSPGTYSTAMQLLGIAGSWVQFQDYATLGYPRRHQASLVARHSGGGTGPGYGLAWIQDLSPSGARLECSRFDGVQGGVQLNVRGTGCGGITFNGVFTSGTTLGSTMTLTHSAAQGLAGWVVGFPVDAPVGPCPGCRQGATGSTLFGGSYTFLVPRDAAFVGMTLAFQGFQIANAGTGACLSQVNLTDTIDATIR